MNDLLDEQQPSQDGQSGATQVTDTIRSSRVVSTKVKQIHLDRQAIVYIRQSSPQQVINHTESAARQYALVDLSLIHI